MALTQWLQREEQLFRALERTIVEDQVKRGFETVDEFLVFSLSVQNRRKSRMGYSLQNQLGALFEASQIRYEPQGYTEGKNRPDFLFPGSMEYRDPGFEAALLVMLGAKSTLKERWRQILTEAERIPVKHLCTLEPGISLDQTEEISLRSVKLVIPQSLHATYLERQRRDIWTLRMFIDFIRGRQRTI